jgi:hypothetical protein
LLLESLAIVEESGTKFLGQVVVENAAALAALLADWRRAAQLYGAADVLCKQIGLERGPVAEAFLSPLISQARGALGAKAFAAAETAGRALSYETGLAEARAWLQEGGTTSASDFVEASRSKPAQ